MDWKKLPIAGCTVDEIVVFGNGKDCQITVTTRDPKKTVRFMMREPDLDIRLAGHVKMVVFNDGHDSYLRVKYIPQEALMLEDCAVEFPGDEKEWDMGLTDFEKGRSDFIGWTIYHAKLQLSPR